MENKPESNDEAQEGQTLAAAPCSAAARDQMWMQEMCELVKAKVPENYTFVVFAFPVKGTDRCYYASNATRESSCAALRQWLEHQKNVDIWMKHDDGPPPKDLIAVIKEIKWTALDTGSASKILGHIVRLCIDAEKATGTYVSPDKRLPLPPNSD